MADRAQLVEHRAIDWDVPKAYDAEHYTYVNWLHALGSKDQETFKRTGYALPVGVNARYDYVQPSLRPFNVRVSRYRAPGGREARWDLVGDQAASYSPSGTGQEAAPPGFIFQPIVANAKPFNFYNGGVF